MICTQYNSRPCIHRYPYLFSSFVYPAIRTILTLTYHRWWLKCRHRYNRLLWGYLRNCIVNTENTHYCTGKRSYFKRICTERSLSFCILITIGCRYMVGIYAFYSTNLILHWWYRSHRGCRSCPTLLLFFLFNFVSCLISCVPRYNMLWHLPLMQVFDDQF